MEFRSPVYHVIAVPIEKIIPNTYNPNTVAPPEMKLLYDSIKEDGYTMPIVCYYAKAKDAYIIVDGFHRYRVMLEHKDIYDREQGMLPVSVIDKPLDQRMASTIRHNRARGSHDVDLMSNIVKELHELGRSDAWISKHLGMDKDEILRLKQITGLAALFKDVKLGKACIQWKRKMRMRQMSTGRKLGKSNNIFSLISCEEKWYNIFVQKRTVKNTKKIFPVGRQTGGALFRDGKRPRLSVVWDID